MNDAEDEALPLVFLGGSPSLRAGLAAILERTGKYKLPVVKDVERWLTRSGRPALLVISIATPQDWETLARTCSSVGSGVGSLRILAVLPDDSVVAHYTALKAGGVGVVAVSASEDEIVRSAELAARGFALLPVSVAHVLASVTTIPSESSWSLEPWEARSLEGIRRGQTVTDLAQREGWSYRHFQRKLTLLCSKLGARHRYEAVEIAVRHGLLTD